MKVPSKEGTFLYCRNSIFCENIFDQKVTKKNFNNKHIFLLFDFKMLRLD